MACVRLPQGDVAVPALLVQATEAWHGVRSSVGERLQRIGDAAKVALGNGHEQQRIALRGRLREHRLAGGQRLGKLPSPEQRSDARAISAPCERSLLTLRLYPCLR